MSADSAKKRRLIPKDGPSEKRRPTMPGRGPKSVYINPIGGSVTDPLNLKGDAKEDTSSHLSSIHKRRYSMKSIINRNAISKKSDRSEPERKARRKEMREKYRYGNFNYFHKMLAPFRTDGRTILMCDDWFAGKDVLDVGCNAGTLSLSIARIFNPKSLLGVDIDKHLIEAARKNIRHFYDKDVKVTNRFPASFPLNFGPICLPPTATTADYPNNIWFRQENVVPESEEDINKFEEKYDTILAFGLTKWIHLNWGDSGLKRTFKRIYKQLKRGGRFVLEPQRRASYAKAAKGIRSLEQNLNEIKLAPEQFYDYLMSEEVGFSCCDLLDTPLVSAYGCDAPILILYKGPLQWDDEPVQNNYQVQISSEPADFSAETPEHVLSETDTI